MIKPFFALKSYLKCHKGATAIEYGLIAAGIALAISASVFFFGDAVSTLLYDDLPAALAGP
jgi:pilus assembly protein Flp/PilA